MSKNGTLAHWRRRIDAINQSLLRLLNQRVRAARRIGLIKRLHGLPVTDVAREREILRRALSQNRAVSGGLDAAAVKRIFSVIIGETKRLERKVLRGKTH